jgi:hypothetical protein
MRLEKLGARHSIEYPAAPARRNDDAAILHQPKMLGNGLRGQLELPGDLTDGPLTVTERPHDHQSSLVAEDTACLGMFPE